MYEYTDWQPEELRFVVLPGVDPQSPRLQQRWTRTKYRQVIDVTKFEGIEEEWREVPTVVTG